jgi:hypothetical protein
MHELDLKTSEICGILTFVISVELNSFTKLPFQSLIIFGQNKLQEMVASDMH